MAKATCSVEDCEEPVHARGWCSKHYQRWRAQGGPLVVEFVRGDDRRRFWAKVDKNGPLATNRPDLGRCWLWTGPMAGGYGEFAVRIAGEVHQEVAHRFAYKDAGGVIPAGAVLDHFACDNPPCVNPTHVRPATTRENVLRSVDGPSAVNARKTHCNSGHAFDDTNTRRRPDGGRDCRACDRARAAKRRARLHS